MLCCDVVTASPPSDHMVLLCFVVVWLQLHLRVITWCCCALLWCGYSFTSEWSHGVVVLCCDVVTASPPSDHMVLLCFVVVWLQLHLRVIHWFFYPHSSGLFDWNCETHTLVSLPVIKPRWMKIISTDSHSEKKTEESTKHAHNSWDIVY